MAPRFGPEKLSTRSDKCIPQALVLGIRPQHKTCRSDQLHRRLYLSWLRSQVALGTVYDAGMRIQRNTSKGQLTLASRVQDSLDELILLGAANHEGPKHVQQKESRTQQCHAASVGPPKGEPGASKQQTNARTQRADLIFGFGPPTIESTGKAFSGEAQ
jgi:hypothetical protein